MTGFPGGDGDDELDMILSSAEHDLLSAIDATLDLDRGAAEIFSMVLPDSRSTDPLIASTPRPVESDPHDVAIAAPLHVIDQVDDLIAAVNRVNSRLMRHLQRTFGHPDQKRAQILLAQLRHRLLLRDIGLSEALQLLDTVERHVTKLTAISDQPWRGKSIDGKLASLRMQVIRLFDNADDSDLAPTGPRT